MLVRACVAVVLAGLLAGPALAQRVASVELRIQPPAGKAPDLDEVLLRRLVRLRTQMQYSDAQADADLASLLATGLLDPTPGRWGCRWELAPEGAVVHYWVTVNPVVTSYSFPGAHRVPTRDLERAAASVLPLGSIYNINRTVALIDALEGEYAKADLAASVSVRPCNQGSVTAVVTEHYLDRVQVEWLGPEICDTNRLVDALDLPRLTPLVPSSLVRAEEYLRGTGLFDQVRVEAGEPSGIGLVNVTVSLRPSALPAPPTAADRALLGPRRVIGSLKWAAPLRLDVPLDLSPPLTPGALRRLASSDRAQDLGAAALAALDLGLDEEATAYARAALRADPASSDPLEWCARVRCSVLVGETPSLDVVPSSPRPAQAAKLAFAVAEVRLAALCDDLGCRPPPPASLRDLAAAAAEGSAPTGLPTKPYAAAMRSATELLLGLESPDDVRACLGEIEELLLARELLREFDRGLRDAPDPLPPFHASAFGNSAVLEALADWHTSDRSSAGPSYALAVYVLGRAFAETRLGRSVAPGGKCYEVGGTVSAALLAERLLAEADRLPDATAIKDLATYQALAVLLTGPAAARDPEFARLLLDPRCHVPEALVYASVASDGCWNLAPAAHRQASAQALARNLGEAGAPAAGRRHLALLALIWSGDLEAAQALADSAYATAATRTPEEQVALGLLALKTGAETGDVETLLSAERLLVSAEAAGVFDPKALGSLIGCARLAAGDIAGADKAFGIPG